MAEASPTTAIRALRPLHVDGVRIEAGATARIRRELVAGLVGIGACDDEIGMEEGEGAAGAAPGGPVPQPEQTGKLEPSVPTAAAAGEHSPSAEANGGGNPVTGADPVPTTDAPREDGGDGSDAGASTDEPAAGAASTPAPAGTDGDNQAATPAPDGGAGSGGAAATDPAPASQATKSSRRARG